MNRRHHGILQYSSTVHIYHDTYTVYNITKMVQHYLQNDLKYKHSSIKVHHGMPYATGMEYQLVLIFLAIQYYGNIAIATIYLASS